MLQLVYKLMVWRINLNNVYVRLHVVPVCVCGLYGVYVTVCVKVYNKYIHTTKTTQTRTLAQHVI
jgi:hypothetical protein